MSAKNPQLICDVCKKEEWASVAKYRWSTVNYNGHGALDMCSLECLITDAKRRYAEREKVRAQIGSAL